MNIQTETNIYESWDNVVYDKIDNSLDFYNEDNKMFVHGVRPESVICMFRNAIAAGCSCTKLQDMDLPDHAIGNLREIHAALNDWINREADKLLIEQVEAPEAEAE